MMASATTPNKKELDKIIKLALVGYFGTIGEYFSSYSSIAAQFATILTESLYNHEVGRQLLKVLYRKAKNAYIAADGNIKLAAELLTESLVKYTRRTFAKTASDYRKPIKLEKLLASYLQESIQPVINRYLDESSANKSTAEKTEQVLKSLIEIGSDIVTAGTLLYNSLVQMYKESIQRAFKNRKQSKDISSFSNAVNYLNNADFREFLEYLKGGAFKQMITTVAEKLPSTNYSTPRFLPTIQ